MHGTGGCDIGRAIEREKARRHFKALDGEELAAEVARHRDAMEIALDDLVKSMTDDAYEQEVHVRRVGLVAEQLAGGSADPTVKMLAPPRPSCGWTPLSPTRRSSGCSGGGC